MSDYPQSPHNFDLQPHHIQFQTNDSQASDTSYQSSLSSNEQDNLGNAEYFREEMSRFFINYPELLNHDLIDSDAHERNLWGDLASDLINQAKEEPISLQGIAKRIAFYRQKTEQADIIDLIVKQKDQILRQLDDQSKMSSQEHINLKPDNSDSKVIASSDANQQVYYSWKKRHEAALINESRKNNQKRLKSATRSGETRNWDSRPASKDRPKAETKDNLHKFKVLRGVSSNSNHMKDNKDKKDIFGKSGDMENLANNEFKSGSLAQNSHLKQMLKFQAKTEAGKQLMEQIKKHNPNDVIGIKRTIVTYLSRHYETIKKGILSKSSLHERLSKLHIEDSKQLMLFCPIKKVSIESDVSLTEETNNFLGTLNEISTGHLMKYWKVLQQRKL